MSSRSAFSLRNFSAANFWASLHVSGGWFSAMNVGSGSSSQISSRPLPSSFPSIMSINPLSRGSSRAANRRRSSACRSSSACAACCSALRTRTTLISSSFTDSKSSGFSSGCDVGSKYSASISVPPILSSATTLRISSFLRRIFSDSLVLSAHTSRSTLLNSFFVCRMASRSKTTWHRFLMSERSSRWEYMSDSSPSPSSSSSACGRLARARVFRATSSSILRANCTFLSSCSSALGCLGSG
mmetsp:Transcript_12764/g.32706  ORF Transcript_12764/g.32706 Transcript_12764/m.32706 type:complete len:242 (+) Transcript_12764:325-1050(+)